jgi:acetyl esterase/lipase
MAGMSEGIRMKKVYKSIEDIQLSLHVFTPSQTPVGEGTGAVMFFHGGGWHDGSPTQFHPQCRYFAGRGLLAVSVEYRLRSVYGTTPYDAVSDAKSAVRWVRSHARELGVDPKRIAAGGGSAGGHLAAATALPAFEEPDEDLSVSSRPDALILFNPAVDNGPDGVCHDRFDERWPQVSPYHNVVSDIPPTLIISGVNDVHIPSQMLKEYTRRLRTAGTRCDLRLYPGQHHGFYNYRDEENPYFEATLFEVDRFLISLGYLDGDPEVLPPTVEVEKS